MNIQSVRWDGAPECRPARTQFEIIIRFSFETITIMTNSNWMSRAGWNWKRFNGRSHGTNAEKINPECTCHQLACTFISLECLLFSYSDLSPRIGKKYDVCCVLYGAVSVCESQSAFLFLSTTCARVHCADIGLAETFEREIELSNQTSK